MYYVAYDALMKCAKHEKYSVTFVDTNGKIISSIVLFNLAAKTAFEGNKAYRRVKFRSFSNKAPKQVSISKKIGTTAAARV
jgi:hypothetical protein